MKKRGGTQQSQPLAPFEAALLAALAELEALGRQCGKRPLAASWQPSNDLKQAVQFGRAPSRSRQDPPSKTA